MQGKFEFFDELPQELQFETAKNLGNRDLANLTQPSQYHLALFKPMVDIRKLLQHVVRGEHDAVQSILKDDISFIFKRSKVTDCSGREFENISAFEYALWALDKHMWTAMIACIPQNEEGKKVCEKLMAQYHKVNTDGVTYSLNGQKITEKHFDFENTIIKELQKQVAAIKTPFWDDILTQWREGVGGAQKLLPVHVVAEYCSNEPFNPVPTFTSQPKSSKQFYNNNTEKMENWFSVGSKLGVDFAIFKTGVLGRGYARVFVTFACRADYVNGDLVAMETLSEVRTKDFINLKSQLEEQMTLDNRRQVAPR